MCKVISLNCARVRISFDWVTNTSEHAGESDLHKCKVDWGNNAEPDCRKITNAAWAYVA